jgi:phage shock protein PspC (stress-responsive transcriptional regulator)
MVPGRAGRDDGAMTTEQTNTALPNEPLAAYRRLERRSTNRVVGGVAGGLADYLNVDPLLIRVGFAGLMLFSGAGIPLYLLGWLFIPLTGRQDSLAMGWFRSLALRPGTVVVLGILFILLFLSFPVMRRLDGWYVPTEVWFALAVVIVGIFLLLPRGQGGTGAARPPAATSAPGPMPPAAAASFDAAAGSSVAAPAAPSYWSAPPAPPAPAIPAEPPRPASPLGWYAVAAAFIALGVVALVDSATPGVAQLADYFGAVLLALGIGLLIGAWWGHARLTILLGLLVVPFALASSFVTVPLTGGFGSRSVQPFTIQDVRPEYRLTAGSFYFDLTELADDTGTAELTASVAGGDITVIVPDNADVDVTASSGLGRLWILGGEQVGTSLLQRVTGNGDPGGPTLLLRLEAGIGEVHVQRAGFERFYQFGG